ncbi:ABC transporter substrate-binding protein [Iodobacter sp.]|uniref:ABC transporter substrate-binding protein n=1 Tax=Iodobacter sp. TaxID=1915058 RepID=UPI0025EEA7BC|nr:ABC transporter substrate-binding protein [Iodobacter sp.]
MNKMFLIASVMAVGISTQVMAAEKVSCGLNNGKKATGQPIPLGAVVGKTGPDDFSSSAQAASAYFKCVNENGGINGRPVEYTVVDDQWNPEIAAQLASKLVQDKKVVAMVGSTSFVECGANAKLYEQAGLMVIAGVGVPRECFQSKNYVPMNTGPRLATTMAAIYANKHYKAKKFVCIAPNIPGLGEWACGGVRAWGGKEGVVSETILIDPGSADASSVILQASSKNPDAIILSLSKGLLIPMLAAAEQQNLGKKIKFLAPASGYNVEVPKAIGPYWKDNFDVSLEFHPLDANTVENTNWLALMNQYGNKKDQRDTFSQAGYLSARLTTETLLKLDPAKITRASVSEALRKIVDFKSELLCRPFYIGTGKRHNANNYSRVASSTGTGWAVRSECSAVLDPELADVQLDEQQLNLRR